MDVNSFVTTLIDYLPEPLRPVWAEMEPRERALRICLLLRRTAGPKFAEPAFSANKALEWLRNAYSTCPEPNASHIAARMTAQVVVMTELH